MYFCLLISIKIHKSSQIWVFDFNFWQASFLCFGVPFLHAQLCLIRGGASFFSSSLSPYITLHAFAGSYVGVISVRMNALRWYYLAQLRCLPNCNCFLFKIVDMCAGCHGRDYQFFVECLSCLTNFSLLRGQVTPVTRLFSFSWI